MPGNDNLHKAKKEQFNEFYTQLSDIENELKHYKEHFKGKIIFCNCDDPYESNFFKYFAMNFNFLGLKKLIATGYSTSPIAFTQLPLFEIQGMENEKNRAYKIEINEVYDANGDGAEDLADVKYLLKTGKGKNKLTLLRGDGDFRSEESIKLLKESDIIITNPPFSLFREYIDQLMYYNKKFLIIGNENAITNREFFPLIQSQKIWLGYNHVKEFYTTESNNNSNTYYDSNGNKKAKFGNIVWYTNLDIKKRHEDLILYKSYDKDYYPLYDNYSIINVKKVDEIPMNYEGIMGVPIGFVEKHNPDQFEIVWQGSGNTRACCPKDILTELGYVVHKDDRGGCPVLFGNRTYSRIFIRRKK